MKAENASAGTRFLLFSVFLDMVGIGIAFPVLPILVGELVETREAQSLWFALLVGSFGLMQFLFAPLLGALSDRFGRRPVLLGSILGLAASYLLTAAADSLAILLLARVVGGITSATISVANAYAADVTSNENRAKGFGQIGAAFGLGFICGPMLGGILGDIDLRLPFYAAAASALLNFAYGFVLVPESLAPELRTPLSLSKVNPFAALLRLASTRGLGRLVAVYSIYQLAHMMLVQSWVLFTNYRFDWGPRENGWALFVIGLNAMIVQGFLLGRLLSVFGIERLARVGLAMGTINYLGYALVPEGWMVMVIIAFGGLSFTTGPALQGIVSRATSADEQGVTMGALGAIGSLMTVLSPAIGLPLLASVSHLPSEDWRLAAPLLLCAALQALALVLAMGRLERRPSPAG